MKNIETGDVPRIKQPILTLTVRARKIKTEEYHELIRWNEWDVERVFHFLNEIPKYNYTLLSENLFAKMEYPYHFKLSTANFLAWLYSFIS
jgi:methionyl-tRNA formyltransferase